MAVYRSPHYCVICGHEFKQKHKDQSHLTPDQRIVGDLFIGYDETHDCKLIQKLNTLIKKSNE